MSEIPSCLAGSVCPAAAGHLLQNAMWHVASCMAVTPGTGDDEMFDRRYPMLGQAGKIYTAPLCHEERGTFHGC